MLCQNPVHRRARHPEQLRELGDVVLTFAVQLHQMTLLGSRQLGCLIDPILRHPKVAQHLPLGGHVLLVGRRSAPFGECNV